MWISQKVWLKEREDSILLRVERDAAATLAKQHETTLAWFMHRLTQIEQERAKLIFTYTGVRVETPTYEAAEPQPIQSGPGNPLNALPTFNDMGEEQAAKDGYGWDTEGNLTLHGQRI